MGAQIELLVEHLILGHGLHAPLASSGNTAPLSLWQGLQNCITRDHKGPWVAHSVPEDAFNQETSNMVFC